MKIDIRTTIKLIDENFVELECYQAATQGDVSQMKSLMDVHAEKVGQLERRLLK